MLRFALLFLNKNFAHVGQFLKLFRAVLLCVVWEWLKLLLAVYFLSYFRNFKHSFQEKLFLPGDLQSDVLFKFVVLQLPHGFDGYEKCLHSGNCNTTILILAIHQALFTAPLALSFYKQLVRSYWSALLVFSRFVLEFV